MDQSPNIVITKSAQMGISERLISEAVWLCDQRNVVALYTFPAQTQLQDFVQARIDPVLNASEYLRSRSSGQEAGDRGQRLMKIGLKRIGNGFLYLRGSTNEKQIITIDADCIFLDERDRFSEDSVPYIEKRLLASSMKWQRAASTPTFPMKGIHAVYMESDQKEWQVECKACGLWQEIDFFKNIDFERKIAMCSSCKQEIDRFADGKWVAKNPESKISGYRVNGLYNPMSTIPDILKKYEQANTSGFSAIQQFFNQDLGLPYEASGQRLTAQELENCKGIYLYPVNTTVDCYAGADVGVKYIHMVVVHKAGVDKYKVIWAGTVKNFTGPYSSIEQVMEKYNIKTLVIDKKPETSKVKELIEKYPKRVFAATYPSMQFSVTEFMLWDDIDFEVRLDRTISLDYTISDIQNRKIEFPRNIESVEGFFDQLMSSIRVTEKNPKTGVENSRWVEKGDDHYLHALNYARAAQTRGATGKALLDYLRKPEQGFTPSLVHWLRVNGQKLE